MYVPVPFVLTQVRSLEKENLVFGNSKSCRLGFRQVLGVWKSSLVSVWSWLGLVMIMILARECSGECKALQCQIVWGRSIQVRMLKVSTDQHHHRPLPSRQAWRPRR